MLTKRSAIAERPRCMVHAAR